MSNTAIAKILIEILPIEKSVGEGLVVA